MATRRVSRASSRDGIVSLLVVVLIAAGFWWWSSRQQAGEAIGAGPSPGATSAAPSTTSRPSPSPVPTRTTAQPAPTTTRPAPSRPAPTRPAPTSTYTPPTYRPVPAGTYAVRWVSDGDTFSIKDRVGQELASVRIIGLNAPEVAHGAVTAECWGPQAAARLKALLGGKSVRLVDDPRAPSFDRFGRRLAYVELGTADVATLMIRDGYAVEFHLPSAGPSVRTPTYVAAQTAAAKAKKGLWGKCPARPDPAKAS